MVRWDQQHGTNCSLDVTGDIVVSGTVDGRDVAADGTTADAALPKAGGTMTGALNFGDNLNINFGAGSDLTFHIITVTAISLILMIKS